MHIVNKVASTSQSYGNIFGQIGKLKYDLQNCDTVSD